MKIIAGVDEAGRGPLAGPVVAAAVILPKTKIIEGLADSKKLTEKKRLLLFKQIMELCDVGIGIVSHRTIDKINILQATYKAMRKAIKNLNQTPDKALIDGYRLPNINIINEGIVDGDNLVECISAASIVAKVTRDRFMKSVDPIFPNYGFAKHKGYGTKEHITSLQTYRATPIHRKTFRPVRENLPNIAWLKHNNELDLLGKQLVALKYLKEGFKIIEVNYSCSNFGYLDVIAKKGEKTVFVYVKTIIREQIENYSSQANEKKEIENKILAVKYYLIDQTEMINLRLDIATVILQKPSKILIKKRIKLNF